MSVYDSLAGAVKGQIQTWSPEIQNWQNRAVHVVLSEKPFCVRHNGEVMYHIREVSTISGHCAVYVGRETEKASYTASFDVSKTAVFAQDCARDFNRLCTIAKMTVHDVSILELPESVRTFQLSPVVEEAIDDAMKGSKTREDAGISDANLLEAFTHFSWEASGRKLGIFDLKKAGSGFCKPTVSSCVGLGLSRVTEFLLLHSCNKVCRNLKLNKLSQEDVWDFKDGDTSHLHYDVGRWKPSPEFARRLKRRQSMHGSLLPPDVEDIAPEEPLPPAEGPLVVPMQRRGSVGDLGIQNPTRNRLPLPPRRQSFQIRALSNRFNAPKADETEPTSPFNGFSSPGGSSGPSSPTLQNLKSGFSSGLRQKGGQHALSTMTRGTQSPANERSPLGSPVAWRITPHHHRAAPGHSKSQRLSHFAGARPFSQTTGSSAGDWLPRTDSPFYSPGSHQSLLSRRSGASALRPLETDFEPGRGSLMSTLRRDPFRSPDRVLSPVHSRKKPRGGSPTKPTLRALVAGSPTISGPRKKEHAKPRLGSPQAWGDVDSGEHADKESLRELQALMKSATVQKRGKRA
mmetsp:Transcript_998/g.2206  ORF Transcript_998/g.2206 Transcript_998/m.2206 type:complete len:572 (+) Transcript_998:212-1927(+)